MEYEVKHLYINAEGKSGTFAKFILKECRREERLARKAKEDYSRWSSLKSLIERYEFVDLAARMALMKQIREILDELLDLSELKNLKQQSDKNSQEAGETKGGSMFLKGSLKKEEKPVDPNLDIAELDIQFVKGVGPVLASKLRSLGINTCEDLLNYVPRKHISYKDKLFIKDLEVDQDVTIFGRVDKVTAFKSPKKNMVIITIIISDQTGRVKVNKFLKGQSSHYLLKQFKSQYPEGTQILCSGKVKPDKYSKQFIIQSPMLEVVAGDFVEGEDNIHTSRIVPIYPLTEGIALTQLRKIIYQALKLYKNNLKEFLPKNILEKYELIGYADAIEQIHFPASIEQKDLACQRMVFNEFFLMQLRFAQRRNQIKRDTEGIQFNCFEGGLVDQFLNSLEFELTGAQKRVFYSEILPDMVSKLPMHRLLQGDVGSGKTVVAFLALLVAIESGYQGALMVPTEVLAEQHYRKLQEWTLKLSIEGSPIKVAILTGKQKAKEKREVLQGLANGQVRMVVGTHALIQDGVEFDNLGLVIVDEQHRFGVKQRDVLTKKGYKGKSENVERLFMTATPIPRTLALTMHGDLDTSEIDEMPLGRLPIKTDIVSKKVEAFNKIREELDKGHQAYVVFPLIDESEALSAKAATVEYENLRDKVFPEKSIGLMHGKLKEDEKEQVMNEFRDGKIDILVSTTVIEVGVDVPNATVMLIESSERFGLAQLHQLRGRVGRSDKQSYCLLSSNSNSQNNMIRLKILTQTNNGFIVAQEDMKLRGAGDFLGIRQSGLPEFAVASFLEHEDVLFLSRKAAREFLTENKLSASKALEKKLSESSYNNMLAAG